MRVLARLMALAAALLMVLPAGVLPALYYCRMMGETTSSCCCGQNDGEQRAKGDTDDHIRQSPCCEIVPRSEATVTGSREATVKIDAAWFVARLPVEYTLEAASRVVMSTPAQARAPPGVGPPLFLTHCSLLI
jgi:hypothetical protein